MKKLLLYLFILCLSFNSAFSQREIVVNTTGYGFDPSQASGIESTFIPYLNSLANLTTSTGQDASVTCVRFYVDWTKYEPTLGDYKWQKLRDAVDYILALKPNMKIALHISSDSHHHSIQYRSASAERYFYVGMIIIGI